MNISQQFAPPFKLIVPFFIIGILVLALSSLLLFSFDIESLHYLNNSSLAWVHLFLLGFVMMIIFGAMAQLVPVVLEVGHFSVDFYYLIYPLLLIGTILMAFGFYSNPILLSFGGIIAFISFAIFLLETFLTIKKVKKLNFVMTSVLLANIFLLFGLIIGIVLALSYGSFIEVNILNLLKAHLYFVLIGYVGVTVMGMSLVLLPMFWLSHNFSWKYVKIALGLLTVSIVLILFSAIFDIQFLLNMGYSLTLVSLGLYFIQIFVIYKKRVRIEKDIYLKSILFSYVSLAISLLLGLYYYFEPDINILLSLFWLAFMGFITFIITGHLYKIIPFLVWYERFSPLVGKKKVPMLADMVPTTSANFQFVFSSLGVGLVFIGLFLNIDEIYKSGVSFLVVGMVFLIKDIFYMINFKD